jgi:hypothetical protein
VQQAYVPSAQPLTDEPSTDHKAIPNIETTDLNWHPPAPGPPASQSAPSELLATKKIEDRDNVKILDFKIFISFKF